MKQKRDPSTKPYYRCLFCPEFRHSCAGLPTRDMNQQDWCEYMRDVKETYHLTNAYIAKEADVSIKTVENIIALNYDKDILRATARRIELAVIGPVSSFICRLDRNDASMTEQLSALQQEVAYWRKENDRKAKIIDKFLTD